MSFESDSKEKLGARRRTLTSRPTGGVTRAEGQAPRTVEKEWQGIAVESCLAY